MHIKRIISSLCFLILYTVCLSSTYVSAKQLSFSKQEKPKSYVFQYRWLDAQENEKDLSFELTKDVLFNQFRNFQTYQPDMVNAYINKNIFKAWRKDPKPQAVLNLKKHQNTFKLELTAQNHDALIMGQEHLAHLTKKVSNTYFETHYYHQFMNYDGKLAIKPNHVEIANKSVQYFKSTKPIILSKIGVENVRTVTNYILGFSQSIPYSTLVSRTTSSGQGFNTPFKLLWENQGDCDSKVTLNAAILRSLMPRVKMIMVFIKGHALLGIEVRPKGNDKTLVYNQITYVLAEPTGPAIWPLGTIADSSDQAILSGLYTAEKIK